MTQRLAIESWSLARRSAMAAALRDFVAQRGGAWKVAFTGRSMAPVLPSASELEVEALPERVQIGDLLVFVSPVPGALCCHRVLAIAGDGTAALTQGLGKARPDRWTDAELWVGTVRAYWVGGRRFEWRGGAAPEVPSAYRRLRQRAMRGLERAASRVAVAG